jgi:hypothetical protein
MHRWMIEPAFTHTNIKILPHLVTGTFFCSTNDSFVLMYFDALLWVLCGVILETCSRGVLILCSAMSRFRFHL